MKTCILCDSVCERRRGWGNSPYCSIECSSAVDRARRKVAYAVSRAIRAGLIVKASLLHCVDCGKPATDHDHRNYFRPLDVDPVCRSCNLKRGAADDVRAFVAAHFCVGIRSIRAAAVESYRNPAVRSTKLGEKKAA